MAVLLGGWAAPASSLGATRYARIVPVCGRAAPRSASCTAFVRVPVATAAAAVAGARPYRAAAGASESGPAEGLTPADLASAYGYNPANGGAGQTVGIIDAYDDPKIEESLATFDSHYGLPKCTAANGCFEKVNQKGSPALNTLPAEDKTAWSVEMSLDVEVVHSVCENCRILVVEANSNLFSDLAEAVDTAVAMGATEVSNSYAGPERQMGVSEQAAYRHPGVVITAATGDDGWYDWDEENEGIATAAEPNVPATIPSVVAVGGTSLYLDPGGARRNEVVWNSDGPADDIGFPPGTEEGDGFAEGATGGGCSPLLAAPPWQRAAPGFAASGCGRGRLDADVAADADPLTGFAVYDDFNCGHFCKQDGAGVGSSWFAIGGTSLSTPLIAALYGLAGGAAGVEYPALTLYGHLIEGTSLYDVTQGGNGYCDGLGAVACGSPPAWFGVVDCHGTTACDAAPGFDGPSGVGTPDGLGLFRPVLPSAVIAAPEDPVAGTALRFTGNRSSDPYPGGAITSYSWSWGDGSAGSAGAAVNHIFAKPGTYRVTLRVGESYGLHSSTSTTLAVLTAAEAEALDRSRRELSLVRQGVDAATVPIPQVGDGSTAPPPAIVATSTVPDAQLVGRVLHVSSAGNLTVRIECPTGISSCAGKVALTSTSLALGEKVRGHSGAEPVLLTLGYFEVEGGRSVLVRLRLFARGRAGLARSAALIVRASILASDPSGAHHTTVESVRLLAPPRGRRGS